MYKGIIIAVNTFHTDNNDVQLKELRNLAASIDIDILGTFKQNRTSVDPKSYAGSGFLLEINGQFEEIDYVIVNDEISANQNRFIESVFDTKVIDRTQVILDIFSLRATSQAGKLQVELAQLEYLVPRLKGEGINLSRLGAGIGTRGPGETKLETDRRHIRTRIKEIKRQLNNVEAHRMRYRENRQRNHVTKLSLIGYTNAGKSTLFNLMASEDTYQKDELFATLDPKTRKMRLPSGFECVLSDTVGFIQHLPTTLVESFKSTLEEAKDSDFILHVIDNNSPNVKIHYDTVKDLMQSLKMDDIPQMVLFNKSDLNRSENLIVEETSIYVHKNMTNFEVLSKIEDFISHHFTPYQVKLNTQQLNKIYDLKKYTIIENEIINDDGTYILNGVEPTGNWVDRIIGSDSDASNS